MILTFESWRRRLNTVLIRSADLDVDGKPPEQIALWEIFGYLDSGGYLILLLSVINILLGGFLFGIAILAIAPESSLLDKIVTEVPVVCAIPGVLMGFVTWHLLFRLKRWLAW